MTESQAPESSPAEGGKPKFHRSFWTANTTELFERAAYYAVASFVVIYLGRLGLGEYWPATFNSLLWGLVYFLPILSGTIADQVGFRRSLLVAFVLLAIGYFSMGAPVWLGFGELGPLTQPDVSAGGDVVAAVILGILLIGAGGSVIKPCISGTVQKTAGRRATLAFAIFYMVINIGSLVGRFIAFIVRKQLDMSFIFAVGVFFSIVSFFVVLLLYRDPEADLPAGEKKPRKPIGRILADMVLVLRSARFTLFLLASVGFFFLYAQVYNVLPMYWERVLEFDPPVDMYTTMNPFVIVFFQLLVTHFFGKMKPINSIIVGIIIISLSMLANLGPLFFCDGGVRSSVDLFAHVFPIASLVGMTTVGLVAFGELFASARSYEYIGALAPKGQEGLFLGYANLPMALGALSGGPIGALIFNEIMCKGATTHLDIFWAPLRSVSAQLGAELGQPLAAAATAGPLHHAALQGPLGLLELESGQNALGWTVLMAIGLGSAVLMLAYNIWLKRQLAKEAPESL
ncbi:MAG: MFS transporter [Deltaproteobacteria bacterium]|nr:MFS transporter [Deltaproteobacteria bacterium]